MYNVKKHLGIPNRKYINYLLLNASWLVFYNECICIKDNR